MQIINLSNGHISYPLFTYHHHLSSSPINTNQYRSSSAVRWVSNLSPYRSPEKSPGDDPQAHRDVFWCEEGGEMRWVISGVLSGEWMVEWVLGGRWVEWLIDGLSTYWWFHFIIILSSLSSSLLSSSSESIYLLLSSSYNRSRSRQKLLSIRSPLPSPTSISFRSLVKSLLPTWIQWSSRRRWYTLMSDEYIYLLTIDVKHLLE